MHLLSSTRGTPTPRAFVRALQTGGNGSGYSQDACHNVSWRDRACLVTLFNGSNFHNAKWDQTHNSRVLDHFLTGNSGLVSQIDYLIDIDRLPRKPTAAIVPKEQSAHIELHILCTERLAQDWRALLGRMRPSGKPRNELIHWNSHGSRAGSALPAGTAPRNTTQEASWLRMSPEDEDYVSTCMHPDDKELHQRYCGQT